MPSWGCWTETARVRVDEPPFLHLLLVVHTNPSHLPYLSLRFSPCLASPPSTYLTSRPGLIHAASSPGSFSIEASRSIEMANKPQHRAKRKGRALAAGSLHSGTSIAKQVHSQAVSLHLGRPLLSQSIQGKSRVSESLATQRFQRCSGLAAWLPHDSIRDWLSTLTLANCPSSRI